MHRWRGRIVWEEDCACPMMQAHMGKGTCMRPRILKLAGVQRRLGLRGQRERLGGAERRGPMKHTTTTMAHVNVKTPRTGETPPLPFMPICAPIVRVASGHLYLMVLLCELPGGQH